MKKIYLTLLLLLCYVFVYSGQVNYENAPIVSWSDLSGVDYSIIYENEDFFAKEFLLGVICQFVDCLNLSNRLFHCS